MKSSPQETMQQAFALHQAGRLVEASDAYRRALKQAPEDAELRCRYGLVLAQMGKKDGAVQQIQQAARQAPSHAAYRLALAQVLESADRMDEAAKAYQDALNILPGWIAARGGLANLFQRMGRLKQAEQEYRYILKDAPDSIPAWVNLGNVLHEQERYKEAVDCFRCAISHAPGQAEAHNNLGNALNELQRSKEAIAVLEQAISLRPDYVQAYNNLGNAYLSMANLDKARICYEQATVHNPRYAEAWHNLGCVYRQLNQYEKALAQCDHALELNPRLVDAHLTRGLCFLDQGRLTEAETSFRSAMTLAPKDMDALTNLCGVLQDSGRLREGVECYRDALAARPDQRTYSMLLLSMHYPSGITPLELFEEHCRWAKMVVNEGSVFNAKIISRSERHRLRIGYVSPDFRRHPVATLLKPVLASRDRSEFEIYCYANVNRPDDVTERFREMSDGWRNIAGRSAVEVASMIFTDEIDILVDLAGHTGDNRLDVFALKPAPVQVSWLGYFNTTGLDAIDYILADEYSVPHDNQQFFVEKVVRLPHSRFCYAGPEEVVPVSCTPVSEKGYISFGSFNHLAKLNPQVVALWARIMREIPQSRLVLKRMQFADKATQKRFVDAFKQHGITADRLDLRAGSTHRKMLEEYRDIDIALDPFPYTGGMTTLEALWMGVPVVTLAGNTLLGRQSASFLRLIGMENLISNDEDGYCDIALRLSADVPGLVTFRSELRQRIQSSTLGDCAAFARDLECVYRQMWGEYCAKIIA